MRFALVKLRAALAAVCESKGVRLALMISLRAWPVAKRLDQPLGLKGGFELGAEF